MNKKNTEENFSKEPVVRMHSSSKTTIVLVGLITFLLGLGLGWYFGKNVNLSVSMQKNNEEVDTVSPTVVKKDTALEDETLEPEDGKIDLTTNPASNPTSVPTITCTSAGLGFTMKIPSDWTCDVSQELLILIKSDVFTLQMSVLGRGGPCPMGEDAAECLQTDFYTRGSIDIDTYTAGEDIKSIFGSLDEASSDKGFTWIDISYTNMATRDLTA